jgi:hypothetical protein
MDSSRRWRYVQNDNDELVLKVNNDGHVCKRKDTIPHCHVSSAAKNPSCLSLENKDIRRILLLALTRV